MNWLIVSPGQQTELDVINDAHPFQKCTSQLTEDGVLVTTADKIGSEYWADWQHWLALLTPFNGDPVWPTAIVEEDTSVDTTT